MAKKARIEDIDSDAVINSFRMDDTSIPPQARSTDGSVQAPSPEDGMRKVIPPPASRPKEEPERRRRNGKPEKTDYDGTFVCEANVTARLGKQVYIRKEYHDRIQKMLHVIGGNEVTIASFLDNVLTHHSHSSKKKSRNRSGGIWNPTIYKQFNQQQEHHEKKDERQSGRQPANKKE